MTTTRYMAKPVQGFTLVEVAIVLVIVGLVLGMTLGVSTGMRDAQNRELARTKLDALDTALANFVVQNKRLPCPATGTVASGALGAGTESIVAGVCTPATEINGVVPWVTLGISESDATDSWDRRITYRVQAALARTVLPTLMDMSSCDPIGAFPAGPSTTLACTAATCTTGSNCMAPTIFLTLKGLQVQDALGTILNNPATGNGAAYVLISHGPNGAGARTRQGTLIVGSGTVGTGETANSNILSVTGAIFWDAQLSDAQTAAHFDDYLSHPTIMAVLNRAGLGPRVHP